MFVRLGTKIINTDNVVEIEVLGSGSTLKLYVNTTAPEGDVANEDGTGSVHPYRIVLYGRDAEKFLAALPVYEPLLEERS